jgi:hypothetical protein
MIDGENYKVTEKTGNFFPGIHFLDKANVTALHAVGTYQISVHSCGPLA